MAYRQKHNAVQDKSYSLAVSVVLLCRKLSGDRKEYVLARQLMKAGTAPGALVQEALQGESRKDFIHKLSIGLKEAHETQYWLRIMMDTEVITPQEYVEPYEYCDEVIRLLTAIIKSAKRSSVGN